MDNIPIVDLTDQGNRFPVGHDGIVTQISKACSQWGFFHVVNHGISPQLIQRVWHETHRFFSLPRKDKLKLLRSKENPRGYYDRELTKNTRDLKEVFDFGRMPRPELADSHPDNRDIINGCNLWPGDLPGFKATMLAYFRACENLGMRLLELFCLGLDSPVDTLYADFKPDHTSFVRLNYYPLQDPLAAEEAAEVTGLGDMALHHHSDAGALTILLQDEVGGLQVYAKDRWWGVEPVEGGLVINTADMMQVWSNDRYRAPLHRVMPTKDKPRYSIPFFFNPSYATDCAPLESLTKEDGPHYRPVNWGSFRQLRTDGDYADYGKEVQLDQYRTC